MPDAIEQAATELGTCVVEAAEAAGEKGTLEGGLWVAGFSHGNQQPECYRIAWPSHQPERVNEQCFGDGDGKQFLDATPLNHADARRQAEKAQEDQRGNDILKHIFGGHTHNVVITANDGPVWGTKPKHGSLGCEELLGIPKSEVEQCDLSEPPSKRISSAMKRLKDEHFFRVNIKGGDTLLS